MKKIILLGLFLTTNVFAQVSIPMEGVGVESQVAKNPRAVGSTFKWGTQTLLKTPVTKVGKIASTCLISKKTCATIALSAGTLAYLYDHPEMVKHYLEKHPEQYDELQKYFDYRKSKAKTPEQIAKYEKAEDDIGINARTAAQQLDLETQNHDFNDILEGLKVEAATIDIAIENEMQQRNEVCSMAITEKLFLDSAAFNKIVNVSLPKSNDGLATLLNVDKYNNLQAKAGEIERNNIPSYKAVEWFFKNKQKVGQLSIDLSKQSFVSSRNKRYRNLNNNLTAINISSETHGEGRTYGQKNEKISELIDGISSESLRLATFKDFATILWYEKFQKT